MKTALNSYYTMNQYEINNLINEFNKDKNIIAKMPDVGDLLRVEIYKNGKEHYYLNVAGFFDPDRGFLKALGEIYERYNKIKNGVAGIGYGIEAYKVYRETKHYKYKNYLQEQGNLFISKINELFKKDYKKYIIDYNCNIIEIIIDESFNSILDGIFNFDNKKKNSVAINYWNIPEIIKAKGIKDYSLIKKEMYSYIVENLQFCMNY